MIRSILIGVLTVGIIGTGIWGYQEHKEKNAILINSENNYQRAFHDLTYQMDLLHDKIGTTLAMNSRKSLSPALAEVWRITSEAHNGVGQLPLTLLPFNKTEEFLSKIGDFSYKTAVRDLDKEPLTDKEYNRLKKLYQQSADIQSELRNVQHMVLKNNLRWMDVEMALASGKEMSDNTIIDGFKTVEKKVEGYDEANVQGPTNLSVEKRKQSFEHLKGKNISKKEAIHIAKKYATLKNIKNVKVTTNGKGADFDFYSVSLSDGPGIEANMDITKKGGYPIWYILQRDVKKQNISLNDAYLKAAQFLKDNKFKDLELLDSSQYDHVGVFTFVLNKQNVRIYPDSIKMKVALDNGQIIGFSASDYLKNNHERKIPKPSIMAEEARKTINPKVKIQEERLAIIENDILDEVLCYDFLGTLGEDTYQIFVNAQTGEEEKVMKLGNAEQKFGETL
ncbi:spore germination protein [Oikeobacillus pervagus]|uniref:Spore germination protein n=1 Tax=Oikeobacillus pervagus TaxID=1325931 RepID=A0AAJ1SYL2_9BACI|nr:germination protein YpeB [Oikeobacillus pervagus]MDQ0213716.1 spore germination protein [Oikeobacillus pervagus]